jgi:hypothetical protein
MESSLLNVNRNSFDCRLGFGEGAVEVVLPETIRSTGDYVREVDRCEAAAAN